MKRTLFVLFSLAFVGCSAAELHDVEHTQSAITVAEELDVEELAFLQKINEYRASKGVAPLQLSLALDKAANAHAVDMASQNYFSHTSKDGTTFDARVKKYYPYSTWLGENIAAGNADAAATFVQWQTSPGHEANMVNANYRVIGIARAYDASSTYRWYWVTDFGGFVDEVASEGGTPPPPPPPAALVANGSFEDGTTGWSISGNATVASGALHVVDPTSGAPTIAQTVAATAGSTYTVTANAKRSSGNSRQTLAIEFLDASSVRLSRSRVSASTSASWSPVTTTATAPSGAAFVRVVIQGNSYSGYVSTYDWDDVRLDAK